MKTGDASGKALIGWQTLLADLSLILFMVTAAAMSASSRPQARAVPTPPNSRCDPAMAEPLAVWRAGGAQTLGHWLAREQADSRQQLTIIAPYGPGAEAGAMAAAQALVSEAGALGQAARVIITPTSRASGDQPSASLAFDRAPDA